MARYLGIDLHRKVLTVCVRTESGRTQTLTWSLKQLESFKKKLRKDDQLAVEATGNTRWFVEQIMGRVARVAVVDPNQFKVISRSVKKTDANDAQLLALFLHKDMLPEVRMKDEDQAQLASLVATRDKLVQLRTTLKNQISNIAAAHGVELKKEALSSEKGLAWVLAAPWTRAVKLQLEVIVEQIRSLNEGIKKLEEQIRDLGSKLEGFENLKSIKGIGDLSASILLSVIGNIDDFADEGKLASYFGIVPRVQQSADTLHSGRITKRGSKLGRTTLVQCALIAQRYSPYLHAYYEKLKARRGTGKAIIATARKLLGIIYNTLKEKWLFADFTNFVLVKS
jgi:transposase